VQFVSVGFREFFGQIFAALFERGVRGANVLVV
jgi:hypothetical protein